MSSLYGRASWCDYWRWRKAGVMAWWWHTICETNMIVIWEEVCKPRCHRVACVQIFKNAKCRVTHPLHSYFHVKRCRAMLYTGILSAWRNAGTGHFPLKYLVQYKLIYFLWGPKLIWRFSHHRGHGEARRAAGRDWLLVVFVTLALTSPFLPIQYSCLLPAQFRHTPDGDCTHPWLKVRYRYSKVPIRHARTFCRIFLEPQFAGISCVERVDLRRARLLCQKYR